MGELKDELDEFDKLNCKFGELNKLKDEFDELMDKLDDIDELKLSFDEIYLFLINVPVNNFSVMLRWKHLFLGITSTFGE